MHHLHRPCSMILLIAAQLITLTPTAAGSISSTPRHQHRRHLGLGKWKDADESEIDCSTASHDFEYYIERCFDETTQWWINGHCIGGVKDEASELHKCMKPDGSRPYCHDCPDTNGEGSGNIKNVCGANSDNSEEICAIAWSGKAENCGDDGLSVYSHQCAPHPDGVSPATKSWYLRENFYCDEGSIWETGPNLEEDLPSLWSCGREWYYEYTEDEHSSGEKHPFATQGNRYCLDCGMNIQVCAGALEATCTSLGLPEKGMSEIISAATTTMAATTSVVATTTTTTATTTAEDITTTNIGDATTATTTESTPASTTTTEMVTTTPAPVPMTPSPVKSTPATSEPSPIPTESKDESANNAGNAKAPPSSAFVQCESNLLVAVVGCVTAWTLSM